jgi:hypothetical protein
LELMAGLLSGTITDLWHQDGALELSSDSVINTTWLSPARLRKRKIWQIIAFLDHIP